MRSTASALALTVALLVGMPLAPADAEEPALSRDAYPVVLLGAQLPMFSIAPNYVEHPPFPMEEEIQDGTYLPLPVITGQSAGAPVERVRARSWSGAGFVDIPTQVDERFVRYLTNYASGFGIYSQADMELGYVFDAEGKKKEGEMPGAPDVATWTMPGDVTTADPVPGLDHDDEVVILFGHMGPRAPSVPEGAHEVSVLDPWTQLTRYAYVDLAPAGWSSPSAGVAYARDADADLYIESNHGDYGGAPGGACHAGDGVDAPIGPVIAACEHRRPKDSATVTTANYQFHYAGRWKMDGLRIAEGAGWSDSLVDRWKGRAFQQREGNALDVGGFEDENDWVRSSVTLGEKSGPVRVLRETWGADSGTGVTRLDVFYPTLFVQSYHVRVHPIPPDGLYAFWDHRAGMVDTYYTSLRPEGVTIDGANDELYGLNSEWQEDLLGESYFTIDAPDPTLQGAIASEMWDQVSGPHGSILSYIHAPDTKSGVLLPYYRDDAAFEDGTGHDAGSWGAHGIHFFFTSDTDNLFLPVPVNEFVAEVHQAFLPGAQPNVGEAWSAMERVPLVAVVAP